MAEFLVEHMHNCVCKTQTATTGTRTPLVASQYSKPLESNVVYIPKTTSSHTTSLTSKLTMVLCNLIGRRRYHDVIKAVSKLAEQLRVNVLLLQFKRLCVSFFVSILIEMNVNISNEPIFSDVYRIVNCIESLAKFT